MATRSRRVLPAVAVVLAGTFVASCGGDGGSGGTMSTKDFCTMINELDQNDPFADLSDTASPEDTKAAFQSVENVINDLYKSAPTEIKADIKTVMDIYGEMIGLFEAADWDYTAIDFEAFSAIDTAAADEASTRLDTWETENCK